MDPLVIEVIQERREKEQIRLVKMAGSEDVGMQTKHGLVQLHWPTLVEAVKTMQREEKKERIRQRIKIWIRKIVYNIRKVLGRLFQDMG